LIDFILLLLRKLAKKRIPNPIRGYETLLVKIYFVSLLAWLLGGIGAVLTHDPITLQIAGISFTDILTFVQQYLSVALAGMIVFAYYLYGRINELFVLFQDPEEGVHHKLTLLEGETKTINTNISEIKVILNRIDTKIDGHIEHHTKK